MRHSSPAAHLCVCVCNLAVVPLFNRHRHSDKRNHPIAEARRHHTCATPAFVFLHWRQWRHPIDDPQRLQGDDPDCHLWIHEATSKTCPWGAVVPSFEKDVQSGTLGHEDLQGQSSLQTSPASRPPALSAAKLVVSICRSPFHTSPGAWTLRLATGLQHFNRTLKLHQRSAKDHPASLFNRTHRSYSSLMELKAIERKLHEICPVALHDKGRWARKAMAARDGIYSRTLKKLTVCSVFSTHVFVSCWQNRNTASCYSML